VEEEKDEEKEEEEEEEEEVTKRKRKCPRLRKFTRGFLGKLLINGKDQAEVRSSPRLLVVSGMQ
jgi:hypothetical protein